jgi:hypothetical protein
LSVFENLVVRRICGPEKEDVIKGGKEKFHNEEFHNSYPSPTIRTITARTIRWPWNVALSVESRNSYRILVGQNNINMSLKAKGHNVWTGFIWLRRVQTVVNMVMEFLVSQR